MNPPLASPRIVSHAEMLIFGIGQECNEAGVGTIPQQWERLRSHIDHIPGQVGDAAYGLISNFPDGKGFLYIAGVEVSKFPPEPADFTRFQVPPQTYAIFRHMGHLSGVLATWQAIYKHGLRDAGYKGLPGPSLERYGPEFSAETGLGGFEIWIPVAPI